jgi:hypothetical protein
VVVLVIVKTVECSIPWINVALHLMEQVQVVDQFMEYVATAALRQQTKHTDDS